MAAGGRGDEGSWFAGGCCAGLASGGWGPEGDTTVCCRFAGQARCRWSSIRGVSSRIAGCVGGPSRVPGRCGVPPWNGVLRAPGRRLRTSRRWPQSLRGIPRSYRRPARRGGTGRPAGLHHPIPARPRGRTTRGRRRCGLRHTGPGPRRLTTGHPRAVGLRDNTQSNSPVHQPHNCGRHSNQRSTVSPSNPTTHFCRCPCAGAGKGPC